MPESVNMVKAQRRKGLRGQSTDRKQQGNNGFTNYFQAEL